MGRNSDVEWTNDTWNPWQCCRPKSPGCKNCYMVRQKKRWGQDTSKVFRSSPATFSSVKRFKGPLVFVCSWSDFFISDADPWRDEAWELMRQRPDLIFQIPTKRTANILDRLPADWGPDGWSNVRIGASIEDQKRANLRIPELAEVPGKHFLSIEPLLDRVDFVRPLDRMVGPVSRFIQWVIVGGESGPGCRPMKKDWALSLRDQSVALDIPFFFKQWGGTSKTNGAWGGNTLNGKIWQQMPGGLKNE